ncbi:MAG TPA: MATE family efflux transporter [Actinomycetota bacterium]|nr:MATE family efflux transporter [Actinomycetota bacterium]
MGDREPIPPGRKIWVVALPVMFAELSETILHVIDTALVGRVGTIELAALVLADTVLEVWLVVVIGLAEALQIVVARRSGEGRDSSVGATFNRAFPVILVTSIGLLVGIKLSSPVVSGLIAESESVARGVDRFLQVAAFGVPFLAASFAYSAFYVGISRTRALILATVVLAAVNGVLGYALVLGRFGAPTLGLEGAAWASVVAEVATALVLALYAFQRQYRTYGIFRSLAPATERIRPLALLAAPIALYGIIEAAQWLFFFVILEQVGTDVLAASNVIYAWLLVLLIPSEAISEVTVSSVSSEIGGAREDRVIRSVRRFLAHGVFASVPVALVAILAPGWVFSIFGGATQPSDEALQALQLVALGLIVGVPALIWTSAVHGTGDTVAGSAFESLGAIAMLAWAFVAAIVVEGGAGAIWAAVPASWALAFAASYAWMKSGRWKRASV